jgi:hypothetical protein
MTIEREGPKWRNSASSSNAMLSRIRGNRRVISAVAITAMLYGVLIVGRLACHRWDASFFIIAGEAFCDPLRAPQKLRISTLRGYDGQFYYRLALDPFTNQRVEYGITIDSPPYRQQRILYPVLAHILALGRIGAVPWSMIVVNYLAVCGLAFNAARLAELCTLPALYGLVIPFFPGVLLALDRDLPDPLAISLMVCALYFLHARRVAFAACMLALAVLTRETVILLAGALFVHSSWRALRKQSAWAESVLLMIPLATYAAWQLWIFARWGTFGPAAGSGNLQRVPLSAVILLVQAVHSALGYQPLQLIELLFLGGMVVLAASVFIQSTVNPGVKLAWLFYLALVAFLSSAVWVEDWAFMRGCAELMVLGFIIVMGARERRLLPIVLAPTLALWGVLAARTIIVQ